LERKPRFEEEPELVVRDPAREAEQPFAGEAMTRRTFYEISVHPPCPHATFLLVLCCELIWLTKPNP
jgi:hypothetical protein